MMILTPKERRLVDAAQREQGVDRRALFKCRVGVRTVARLVQYGLLKRAGDTFADATYHTTDAGKAALAAPQVISIRER